LKGSASVRDFTWNSLPSVSLSLFRGHDFYTVVTTFTSHIYCLNVMRLIIEVGRNMQILKNNDNIIKP